MAVPTKPQTINAYGNDRVWLVDTIADIAAPTTTEINAGFYLPCYLLGDQEFFTATVEKVTKPRLLCETDQYQALGTRTWDASDLMGVYDPQGAAASTGKAAYELIEDGYTGFMVISGGIDADADDQATVGEWVNVAPVDIRLSVPLRKTSTGADGIYVFGATVAVTGEPGLNISLAT